MNVYKNHTLFLRKYSVFLFVNANRGGFYSSSATKTVLFQAGCQVSGKLLST